MKFNNETLTIDKPSEFINLKDKINNNGTSYFEFKQKLNVNYFKVYIFYGKLMYNKSLFFIYLKLDNLLLIFIFNK